MVSALWCTRSSPHSRIECRKKGGAANLRLALEMLGSVLRLRGYEEGIYKAGVLR